MSVIFGKVLLVLGATVLFLATLTGVQYKRYLRQYHSREAANDESMSLEIHLLCAAGLLLTAFGSLHVAGELKPVLASGAYGSKSMDALAARPGFMHFNHRGAVELAKKK